MKFSQRCWRKFRSTGAWRCFNWQLPTFRKILLPPSSVSSQSKEDPWALKMASYGRLLYIQKTSSALRFAQSMGKQPYRNSNPYHSETSLYQKWKGLFRFRQIPLHIGTEVRILGFTGVFRYRPVSVMPTFRKNRYYCIKKRTDGKYNLYNIRNLVK
jgi:hypothetical protein